MDPNSPFAFRIPREPEPLLKLRPATSRPLPPRPSPFKTFWPLPRMTTSFMRFLEENDLSYHDFLYAVRDVQVHYGPPPQAVRNALPPSLPRKEETAKRGSQKKEKRKTRRAEEKEVSRAAWREPTLEDYDRLPPPPQPFVPNAPADPDEFCCPPRDFLPNAPADPSAFCASPSPDL